MAERLYRVRNPNGEELGPALPLQICDWITEGRIMLDATVSDGSAAEQPVTQVPLFARAFEARYGVGGRLHGSDSTPSASLRAIATPPGEKTESTERKAALSAPSETVPVRAALTDDEATMRLDSSLAAPSDPAPAVFPDTLETPSGEETPIEPSFAVVPVPDELLVDPADKTPISHEPPVHTQTGDLEVHTPVTQSAVEGLASDPSVPAPSMETLPVIASPLAAAPVIIPPPTADTTVLPPVREASRRLPIAIITSAIGFALLFSAGVLARLGVSEAEYSASSGFFYARVLVLAGAGVGLSMLIVERRPLTNAMLVVSPRWIALGIAAGGVIGALSPIAKIGSTVPVALSMTFLHVLAEETYFRFFLDRVLRQSIGGVVRPAVLGGVAFGVYQLTYSALWDGRTAVETISLAIAMAIIAGVPYSLIYHSSRSLVPAFICHLTANVTMIALSAL